GAGFNFGVVVEFEFDAAQVTNVGAGQFTFDISADPARFLHRWGAAVAASPRDATSFLTIGAARGGQLIAHTMNVVDSEDPETILDRLRPLAEPGTLLHTTRWSFPITRSSPPAPAWGTRVLGSPPLDPGCSRPSPKDSPPRQPPCCEAAGPVSSRSADLGALPGMLPRRRPRSPTAAPGSRFSRWERPAA